MAASRPDVLDNVVPTGDFPSPFFSASEHEEEDSAPSEHADEQPRAKQPRPSADFYKDHPEDFYKDIDERARSRGAVRFNRYLVGKSTKTTAYTVPVIIKDNLGVCDADFTGERTSFLRAMPWTDHFNLARLAYEKNLVVKCNSARSSLLAAGVDVHKLTFGEVDTSRLFPRSRVLRDVDAFSSEIGRNLLPSTGSNFFRKLYLYMEFCLTCISDHKKCALQQVDFAVELSVPSMPNAHVVVTHDITRAYHKSAMLYMENSDKNIYSFCNMSDHEIPRGLLQFYTDIFAPIRKNGDEIFILRTERGDNQILSFPNIDGNGIFFLRYPLAPGMAFTLRVFKAKTDVVKLPPYSDLWTPREQIK